MITLFLTANSIVILSWLLRQMNTDRASLAAFAALMWALLYVCAPHVLLGLAAAGSLLIGIQYALKRLAGREPLSATATFIAEPAATNHRFFGTGSVVPECDNARSAKRAWPRPCGAAL